MAISRIPLLVPDMPPAAAVQPYVARMDTARWYSNFGPLVRELEQALSARLEGAHVATTANCTLALELGLAALEFKGRAPRVLLPAFTFLATAAAARRAGCELLLADMDADTWLLTPDIARAALEAQPYDCVLPVAALGNPQDAAAWDRFSAETGVPVLIDAAGAFGNQAVGARTRVAYSFHATKALGMGEGGLVASHDPAWPAQVKRLSNFGIDVSNGFAAHVGSNAKMSEYHAAVGLAALERWPQRRGLRQRLAADYAAVLARHCPQVTLQARPDDGAYTILQVLLPPGCDRAAVMQSLREAGIETRVWYQPLTHDHPAFEDCPAVDGLPVTRERAARMLGLPFHLELGLEQVETIGLALARSL